MKLITIIPAYNEEVAIKNVVETALAYSDVLVVDDGSTDRTSQLAKEAGAEVFKHPQNEGKGAAIKTGLKTGLEHGYNTFVVLDGDGQHDPNDIPSLTSAINGAEVVIGSRFKKNLPENIPIQRKLSNAITTKFMRYVTGYTLTDSQCGFRAISNDAAKLFLDIKYDDYVYESEMFYVASKNNITIEEASISCKYGDEKSYVTWRSVLNYIFFILMILLRKLKESIKL
ncbi:glycosyltransferase family 2 protein [Methanobacterium paludis]|uniref:Glycosyl transferase family 2 n=1 Tax=Methanobacterium paludis (strain DSM 25820 / JCM 18151 / SWAN1) TaxID=868131 RepID=F6D1J6_METPW|nr:glycosyltransferase family 2 protein [Methanobacterium paludis]AEG17224.1 glycosyl transferase family 2 [Methanobacterium paludis]